METLWDTIELVTLNLPGHMMTMYEKAVAQIGAMRTVPLITRIQVDSRTPAIPGCLLQKP